MPSQAWMWLFNTQLYIAIPGLYKTAFDVNQSHSCFEPEEMGQGWSWHMFASALLVRS